MVDILFCCIDWELGARTSLKVSFKLLFDKNIMKTYYMATIALGKGRFILEHDFIILFISYSRNKGKGNFLPLRGFRGHKLRQER